MCHIFALGAETEYYTTRRLCDPLVWNLGQIVLWQCCQINAKSSETQISPMLWQHFFKVCIRSICHVFALGTKTEYYTTRRILWSTPTKLWTNCVVAVLLNNMQHRGPYETKISSMLWQQNFMYLGQIVFCVVAVLPNNMNHNGTSETQISPIWLLYYTVKEVIFVGVHFCS